MSACLVLFGVLFGCSAPGGPPPQPVPAASDDRWVAEDKLQHFAMSFAVTGMTYGGGRLALDPAPARAVAAGVTLSLGVGKELTDARRGGPFSVKDLAWDAAGVALGFVFAQRMD